MVSHNLAYTAERGLRHGALEDYSVRYEEIMHALEGSGNWPKLSAGQRTGLRQIVHKIARILTGNPDFADHWEDIAGYAEAVVTEVLPRLRTDQTAAEAILGCGAAQDYLKHRALKGAKPLVEGGSFVGDAMALDRERYLETAKVHRDRNGAVVPNPITGELSGITPDF